MITIIAALAKNGIIGKKGKLPWHISEEMQHFKKITWGNTVIMGRKTFEALGKPLPHRNNIVISKSLPEKEGILVCNDFQEGIEQAKKIGKEIMIIGGENIYQQAIPFADKMILSHLNQDYEGDTLFPKLNLQEWEIISMEEKNEFKIVTYVRRL